jgi:putative phosphoesterase
MRIGIVSDIHANAAGLQLALERMGDVDELLCAGDIVEDYRFSNESGLIEWLDAQTLMIETTVNGKKLVMTHASPFHPHNQYVARHSPELRRFGEIDADYVVIGHTHAQMAVRVGATLVINPGSVGQAIDHNNGRKFSYAILDTTTDEVVFDDYELCVVDPIHQ